MTPTAPDDPTKSPATPTPDPTATPGPTPTPTPTPAPNAHCTFECEALLEATANLADWENTLNWHRNVPLKDWDGVRVDSSGSIVTIDLSNSGLSGSIPQTLIDHLHDLRFLDLSDNGLTGTIPDEFNLLREDIFLRLDGNNFTGCVPGTVYQFPNADVRDIEMEVCVPDHQTITTNSDCMDTVNSHDTERATTSDHVGISLRVGGYVGTSEQLNRFGQTMYGLSGGDPQDYEGVHPCYGAQVQVMSSVTSTSAVTISGFYQNLGDTEYPTKIRSHTRLCGRTSCLLNGSYLVHTENHSPLNENPDNYVAYFYADVEYLGLGTMDIETAGVTISGHNPQVVVPIAPPRMGTLEGEAKGRTEIKLSWAPPTGSVRYYNVQYRAWGDRWGSETESLGDRHITISDLECGTTYEFRVRAKSGGDEWYDIWGPPSEEKTVVTERC